MGNRRAVVRIDRLSANDLTTLATDRGPVPMNIAAVLVVEGGEPLAAREVTRLLDQRIVAVPRLRQRLRRAPLGCGRPYWVPDDRFDIERHLHAHAVDGFDGLLDLAAACVCRPLPQDRPLWDAHWVTGVGDGRAALVIVAHHVLADGIGGLAVIGALTDPPDDRRTVGQTGRESPAPTELSTALSTALPTQLPTELPTPRELAVDAWRHRLAALTGVGARARLALHGLRDLGIGVHRPRLVARTSLNRPTGPRRRVSTIEVPLARVVDAAHRHGCTVNDLVVAAVVGALTDVLADRGEAVESLVVSVPYSARRTASAGSLGNESGVVPFRVPGTGADPLDRLRRVSIQSRAQRGRPRAASAAPLGVVFRGLARIGVFRWFVDRQRLVTTFVTNLRGPAQPLHFGGCRVSRVVPVAVTPGNTAVTFDVLSYAGRLGVSVVADPVLVPDQAGVTTRLRSRLDELVATPTR